MIGIILLDKQKDITSFSACNRVKHILGVKKAGHTGTLDPMATGVLTVALGGATRFIELLPVHDKSYIARVQLGITTDTLDITGNVLSENEVSVTYNDLLSAALKFQGEIMQKPPMYSAVFKDGKRLYELARQGIEVERDARPVTIHRLEVSDFDGKLFTMKVACSSGTYIRTLCDDIGKALGCGAVLTELRRTSANGFSIENCHTINEIKEACESGSINNYIIPVEKCFEAYGQITVSPAQAKRFSNGGELSLDRLKGEFESTLYRVYSPENKFLGLGQAEKEKGILSVRRLLVNV